MPPHFRPIMHPQISWQGTLADSAEEKCAFDVTAQACQAPASQLAVFLRCFILFWRLRCRLIGRGSPHSTTDDTLVLYVYGPSGLLGVASQLVAALWDCHWTLGEESTQGWTEAETDEREAIVCVTK